MRLLKNRLFIGISCIVISLVIGFVLLPIFNQKMAEKVAVVRVVKKIERGEIISQAHIKSIEVFSYHLPENALRQEDDVIGSYAQDTFYPGDFVLREKLSKTLPQAVDFKCLDGVKQAMSISIKSLAKGVSGHIREGDIVSVIAANYKGGDQSVILPALNYVKVISVTDKTGTAQSRYESDGQGEKERIVAVTLLVTAYQSELLASLEAENSIHLSLVYRGEDDKAAALLKAQDELLLALLKKDEMGGALTDENAQPAEGVQRD